MLASTFSTPRTRIRFRILSLFQHRLYRMKARLWLLLLLLLLRGSLRNQKPRIHCAAFLTMFCAYVQCRWSPRLDLHYEREKTKDYPHHHSIRTGLLWRIRFTLVRLVGKFRNPPLGVGEGCAWQNTATLSLLAFYVQAAILALGR